MIKDIDIPKARVGGGNSLKREIWIKNGFSDDYK